MKNIYQMEQPAFRDHPAPPIPLWVGVTAGKAAAWVAKAIDPMPKSRAIGKTAREFLEGVKLGFRG